MTPKILFIFPHPDDEAFTAGGTLARYGLSGDAEVHLYTMTRGEASRIVQLLKLSPDELARRREEEIQRSSEILGVASFRQGEYADKGMHLLDPRIIERDIEDYIRSIEPNVIVTFDVQGGSGHSDHIVVHHIVKRVFCEMKESVDYLRRLAFVSLPEELVNDWPRKVFGVPWDQIDAAVDVSAYNDKEREAILAHESMRQDFEDNNFNNWMLWETEYYSFFQESHQPPLGDLLSGLNS
ncbi:MAG: hypothetical protein CL946_05395 [Ectothiorhodospiraceae bacterium]|nr:hypothetical protein [Ectothiorhodospiraceae bacterium]